MIQGHNIPSAPSPARSSPSHPASAPADDYDDQTVRALRALAREREDERLTGRAIARANKAELVAFLRASDANSP